MTEIIPKLEYVTIKRSEYDALYGNADFLCARLRDLEGFDGDELLRQLMGHVLPALARLESTLAKARGGMEYDYLRAVAATAEGSEPTPEMIEAATDAFNKWQRTQTKEPPWGAIYTAMRALERPSDEAVERVARAIAEYRYKPGYRYDDMSDSEREFVRGEARAAIAAMQEQSK